MPRAEHRDQGFLALVVASAVSNLGDGIRLAALPLLATTITTSPVMIGAVTAAQFLPWVTFAPFGGVIVDRADRRRLVLITQTWRAAVMVGLTVAVLTERVEIWMLFVVAFVITVGEILVDPSVVAMVKRLVVPEQLDRANSRLTTVEVATNEFIGTPVGAATFTVAPWLPFLIDAATYLGSTGPFGRVPKAPAPQHTAPPASFRDEVGEGVRWVLNHAFLRPLTFAIAVFHLGTAGAFSLLVLVVTDVLAAPQYVFGVALAASAVGATLASLISARLTDRYSRRSVITTAAVVTALSVIAVGAVQAEWQLIVFWAVNGAAGGVLLSIGRGFIQRHTPNEVLGRAAIASRMITRSAFVVGALAAGVIAATVSIRSSFYVAGMLHLAGTAMLFRSFRFEDAPAPRET